MSEEVLMVKCPTCQKKVAWLPENTSRPFCSERCKRIDLGAWAAEEFRVPSRESEADSAPDSQDA
mgnify:CR=1 FL=1